MALERKFQYPSKYTHQALHALWGLGWGTSWECFHSLLTCRMEFCICHAGLSHATPKRRNRSERNRGIVSVFTNLYSVTWQISSEMLTTLEQHFYRNTMVLTVAKAFSWTLIQGKQQSDTQKTVIYFDSLIEATTVKAHMITCLFSVAGIVSKMDLLAEITAGNIQHHSFWITWFKEQLITT